MGRAAIAASELGWGESVGGRAPRAEPPASQTAVLGGLGGSGAAGARGPGRATSFFVDCRLFRVSPDEAEQARQTVGAEDPDDKKLAGGIVNAILGGATGIVGATAGSRAGAITGGATGGLSSGLGSFGIGDGSAGGMGGADAGHAGFNMAAGIASAAMRFGQQPKQSLDPDHQTQCSQLQGLFARRVIKTGARGEGKHNLLGNTKKLDLFVKHSPSGAWYKCGVKGAKEKSELQCAPYEAVSDKMCSKKCDLNRQTFRTKCLKKQTSLLGSLFGGTQCLYVGHFGQRQPADIMGKAAPYAVYILGAPHPAASALFAPVPAIEPSADARSALAFRRPSGWRCGDFLAGPSEGRPRTDG